MSDGGRYRKMIEAFQYVDDRFLDMTEQEGDVQERRERKNCERKRRPAGVGFAAFGAAAAACICVLLALPAGVMAGNWFGLRNLLVPDGNNDYHDYPDDTGHTAGSDYTDYVIDSAYMTIALSGYQGSSEMEALREWNEFLAHYNTDHSILDALGNGIFAVEGREDWSQYRVYSMEMGEKLDEIVQKYGLKLHTRIDVVEPDELEDRVGGSFLAEECRGYTGYIYEDGSFQLDGDVDLRGCGNAGFQFRRVVKGTFDEVALNIGQVEDYTEWQYVSACGEPVLLELGANKALIFADYENCFIAVNVLAGSVDGMTKEDLQELADKADFSILKQ
ncbi:MAG: hypothetical protein K2H41_12920 [Acetatifactor sp.]|nr:hypothetical protein [Acetatifactor sp.]